MSTVLRVVHFRAVPAPLRPPELMPLDEMLARLDRVLAASPADETEIAWLEVRRGRDGFGEGARKPMDGERRERTLLVRVRESGRAGFHRTGESTVSELENAVRMALAQARLAPSPASTGSPASTASTASPAFRTAPKPASSASLPENRPTDRGLELLDPELAQLSPGKARELVQRLAGKEGSARLAWASARVAVGRGDGWRRSAEITAAGLEVRHGSGPGGGRAATAARSWAGLDAEAVAERARRLAAPPDLAAIDDISDLAQGPLPLLLAPEATAALIDLLNRQALSSTAFKESTSFLCERLGQQVFHPALSLRDDGTHPGGLPFPFDLAGDAKRPVDLITEGVVLTPAVDADLGERLGRESTAHAVALDESLATHLFLRPGDCDEAEALRRAEGGLSIGWLSGLSGFAGIASNANNVGNAGNDTRELRFRAVAHGVRRIESGARGRALPDLVWEGNLAAVLTGLLGVGREAIVIADEPLLGAVSAPALMIAPTGSLRLARP
jgi:predicted Zn-dependent protease